MLEIDRIDVAYGAIRALQGVSLSIQAGEVVTLIGANGAGKTTTIRTISGLLRPTAGAIGAAIAKLMREDPANQVMEDLRRLKQLMETGEIATTEGQATGKEAAPETP